MANTSRRSRKEIEDTRWSEELQAAFDWISIALSEHGKGADLSTVVAHLLDKLKEFDPIAHATYLRMFTRLDVLDETRISE